MGSMADKLAAALASIDRPAKPHNVASPQDATGCCSAINKALRKGELETVDVWVCSKCGMEWRPRLIGFGCVAQFADCVTTGGIRYWQAQPIVMLWK